jgi:myo-inositol-1(or 4)-monophosphatase
VTSATGLLDLAVEVATEAAGLVRRHRRGAVSVAATKSSTVDVVTEADRASEELIRSRLLAARPDDAVLGEEGGSSDGGSGVRWIVDPIDGTVNFLYGIPAYAVSLAAEVDGTVVAGVVADVAAGTTYTAVAGGGARRDDVPLSVRGPAPLDQRMVLTGFSYEAAQREIQAAAVARMLPRVRDIRRFGSCALDLCRIAEGTADGYVEEGVSLWDHAAGGLVAVEAGARCELHPGRGGRDAVVCAPAHGFEELLALVSDCGFLATNPGTDRE